MFVIPLNVLIAWALNLPMSLDFHLFESGTLFITTILVSFIAQGGTSNWLQGAMLIMAYIVIAAGYWIIAEPPST